MNNTELKKFIENFLENVSKYSLMYGGNLEGVESVWHTLMAFESFANGEDPNDRLWDLAYDQISDKYRCGSWALCSKVAKQYDSEDDVMAAEELIRRLQEVRVLKYRLMFLNLLKNKRNQEESKMSDNVTFEDFCKVDIRAGTIKSAERVPKSDKLLKLQVDFGELGTRQIVAGIGKNFEPDKISGVRIVAVVNLQPRKLMGLESHGMILAAQGKSGLALLTIDQNEISDGTRIG